MLSETYETSAANCNLVAGISAGTKEYKSRTWNAISRNFLAALIRRNEDFRLRSQTKLNESSFAGGLEEPEKSGRMLPVESYELHQESNIEGGRLQDWKVMVVHRPEG